MGYSTKINKFLQQRLISKTHWMFLYCVLFSFSILDLCAFQVIVYFSEYREIWWTNGLGFPLWSGSASLMRITVPHRSVLFSSWSFSSRGSDNRASCSANLCLGILYIQVAFTSNQDQNLFSLESNFWCNRALQLLTLSYWHQITT